MSTKDSICYSSQITFTEKIQNLKGAKLKPSIKSSLSILSFAIFVFAVFSHTVTWHFQNFWRASGDFWQSQYNKICSWFGYDAYSINVWGTFLIAFVMYWFIGLWYTIIDMTGKPSFMLRYRTRNNEQYPVSLPQVLKAIHPVLINQTLAGIPFSILMHHLMVWRGYDSGITLPPFQRILLELISCTLIQEVSSYYSHRLMHYPPVYKYIHKEHHEWTSPIAISAAYCHPVEHIFLNLLPILLGPLILGSHIATLWLWISMVTFTTLNLHSGFNFPLGKLSEFHDFHHLKFNQNFGVWGILDRLHGTGSFFRHSKTH